MTENVIQRQPVVVRVLAKVLSYVFHPLFIPTYIFLWMVLRFPYEFIGLQGHDLTLREIGEKYGISRERVRQIEERVKKKLKTYLKDIRDVDDASGVR